MIMCSVLTSTWEIHIFCLSGLSRCDLEELANSKFYGQQNENNISGVRNYPVVTKVDKQFAIFKKDMKLIIIKIIFSACICSEKI